MGRIHIHPYYFLWSPRNTQRQLKSDSPISAGSSQFGLPYPILCGLNDDQGICACTYIHNRCAQGWHTHTLGRGQSEHYWIWWSRKRKCTVTLRQVHNLDSFVIGNGEYRQYQVYCMWCNVSHAGAKWCCQARKAIERIGMDGDEALKEMQYVLSFQIGDHFSKCIQKLPLTSDILVYFSLLVDVCNEDLVVLLRFFDISIALLTLQLPMVVLLLQFLLKLMNV